MSTKKGIWTIKKEKGGDNMAEYIVKLTENKGRHSITIPVDLIRRRELAKYEYLLIKASGNKPIIIRGLDYDKSSK